MRNSQDKPASFISKLCNILRSKEHAKVIYWDCDRRGIRILNQKKLEETILPRYYRHNRFSSFVRQLNMYDFHKVYIEDHKSIFLHENFNPKDKENIHLIRRKITSTEESPPEEKENKTLPLKSIKEILPTSIRQTSLRNSIRVFRSDKLPSETESIDPMIKQIMGIILQQKLTADHVREKIKQLKHCKRFRSFLKRNSFLEKLHNSLGIDMVEETDQLSELSIEDQLLYNTRKSLPQRSLRLLESGPLNFCDTFKLLLSTSL